MTSQELFLALLHRLQRYPDAMVLHAMLRQQADVSEFKGSASHISLDLLGSLVHMRQVQRSLTRLGEAGLLQCRTHANYKTHVTVDRAAVKALLRTPISPYVPGVIDDGFSLLDELNAEAEADANKVADEAIKRASDLHKPDQPDAS